MPAVVLLALLALAGCEGGTMGGMTSWGAGSWNTGAGSQSVPSVAWQTAGQRKDLNAQTDAAVAAAPATPVPAAKRKVALLVPLSGKNEQLGQAMLKAAQMALFDIGGNHIALVPKDSGVTPASAAAAARSAIDDGVDIILGPIFADDVRAVKPVTEAAGKPMIAFTTDWTLAGGNTYVMGFVPQMQVARVASFAAARGNDYFAAFGPRTPYCDIVFDTLKKTGVKVIRTEQYDPAAPNLSPAISSFVEASKMKNSAGAASLSFNALMLPVGGENLASIISMLDLQGVNAKNTRFIGTGLWDDPALMSNPALYGGWFAAPDPQLRRDFEKRYNENYGGTPPRLSSLAYDATALAAVLAGTAGDGDAYQRSRITGAQGFAGIDGIFRFRADGLAERGLAVLEVQSGRARVIDPAPKSF